MTRLKHMSQDPDVGSAPSRKDKSPKVQTVEEIGKETNVRESVSSFIYYRFQRLENNI